MAREKDVNQRTYSAEEVRQGEVILRTRTRRLIFIAGLAGLVIMALVLQFALSR
jgi:hypothetical protein